MDLQSELPFAAAMHRARRRRPVLSRCVRPVRRRGAPTSWSRVSAGLVASSMRVTFATARSLFDLGLQAPDANGTARDCGDLRGLELRLVAGVTPGVRQSGETAPAGKPARAFPGLEVAPFMPPDADTPPFHRRRRARRSPCRNRRGLPRGVRGVRMRSFSTMRAGSTPFPSRIAFSFSRRAKSARSPSCDHF